MIDLVRRHRSAASFVFLAAMFTFSVWSIQNEADARARADCDNIYENRFLLRGLVEVVTSPEGELTLDLTAIEGFDQIADPAMQAYLATLSALISAPRPNNVEERLGRYADTLELPDC